jgi:hypothetical protein
MSLYPFHLGQIISTVWGKMTCMTNNMVYVSNAESGTKCLKMTNPNMDSLKRPWCLPWTLLGWSLGSRKCLDATGHEIWHGTTAPHLINMQIYVHCR